jgi:hypothetical protein
MSASPKRQASLLILAAAAVLLAGGCSRDGDAEGAGKGDFVTATLPEPEAGAGSVTGLSGSRPGDATAVPIAAPEDLDDAGAEADMGLDGDAPPLLAPEGDAGDAESIADADEEDEDERGDEDADAEAPAPTPAPPAANEPTPADAAAVLRSYYGSIDAGNYERAYRYWSGEGRSSGQTVSEFAGGFQATTGVSAQTGTPGRVEGAAGSRYVRIPVTVRAVHEDGSTHRYKGTYTLRRAVVDGASDEQRAWRIESADLREVQ